MSFLSPRGLLLDTNYMLASDILQGIQEPGESGVGGRGFRGGDWRDGEKMVPPAFAIMCVQWRERKLPSGNNF